MAAASEIFGRWAFRKADSYPHRRKPISKALFEVWSVCLAKLPDKDRNTLIKQKETVVEKFVRICDINSPFWNAITSSTGEKTSVDERFKRIENLVSEVLND